MAAPVSTPENPLGMNGCQFSVFTARAAPKTNIRIAAILIITITLFALALSRTPRTRIQVSAMITSSAGRLNQLPVNWPPSDHGLGKLLRQMDAESASRKSLK